MIRLADFVVKFLEKKKIDTVFTVSGGGSIFLCDALYNSKKIKYICHHHEQAASFAAVGSIHALWKDHLDTDPSVTESYHFNIETSVDVCLGNQYHS